MSVPATHALREEGLARSDAPISAAAPVDEEAAVFVRCLLPREVPSVEWVDLAVGEEVVEVLADRPRHEVIVASATISVGVVIVGSRSRTG